VDLQERAFVVPRKIYFAVFVTLGIKTVLAAKTFELPEQILSAIKKAPEYAEGKSIRLDIRSEKDVEPVR